MIFEVTTLKCFIMINAEPGMEKAVKDCLEGITGISEVVPVYGEWDFIAITNVDTMYDLNRAVLSLREIDGVTNTMTVIGTEMS
jgi:DNA-binding Lrp family transcriptional regulator